VSAARRAPIRRRVRAYFDTAAALGIASAGQTKDQTAAQMEIYRTALGDLPGDLLVLAMRGDLARMALSVRPKAGGSPGAYSERVSRRRKARSDARWAARLAERHGLPVGLLARLGPLRRRRERELPDDLKAELEAIKRRSRSPSANPLKPPPHRARPGTGRCRRDPAGSGAPVERRAWV